LVNFAWSPLLTIDFVVGLMYTSRDRYAKNSLLMLNDEHVRMLPFDCISTFRYECPRLFASLLNGSICLSIPLHSGRHGPARPGGAWEWPPCFPGRTYVTTELGSESKRCNHHNVEVPLAANILLCIAFRIVCPNRCPNPIFYFRA